MQTLLQDLRFGIRMLRKSAGFTGVAVLTLALGLGLNIAFFTIFNMFVLRPFAVRDPYSLFRVALLTKEHGRYFGHPWRRFDDLRSETGVFSEALAQHQVFANLEGKVSRGLIVSGNYFSMLGGETLMGRPIQNADTVEVIVLSHRAWKNRLSSDSDIVGKAVNLGKHPCVVIGVARPTFQGLETTPPDFWMPMAGWSQVAQSADTPDLEVVGRLREGVTTEQAEAALSAYARRATADEPQERRAFGVGLQSAATVIPLPPQASLAILPLLVAFALTMAIPCANVANMMLARALARQREIGLRLALGASRTRVIRQLLTEGLLLAILASLAGIWIAQVTVDLGIRLLLATIPSPAVPFVGSLIMDPTVDFRVLVFVPLVAVLTAVAFALAPALQATRVGVCSALRGEFAGVRTSRLRNALVVGQVALCLLLLVCTGMLLRGTERMISIDPGYDGRGVHSFMSITPIRLAEVAAFLERQPWVEAVAYSSELRQIRVDPSPDNRMQAATSSFVTLEYFRMFRIPIIRGRNFTKEEALSGAAVVLVSQATANRFWPGKEPVGKTLRIDLSPSRNRGNDRLPHFARAEVIGVTKDVTSGPVWAGVDRTRLYFPAIFEGSQESGVFVRGKGDDQKTWQLLEEALTQIAPDTLPSVYSVEQRKYWDLYPVRAASWVSSLLGGLALLLTLSGIYGVMSYLVNQQTREIGIRLALGAQRRDVLRLVLRDGLYLVAVGVALGLTGSFTMSRVLSRFLFGLSPVDPVAFLSAPLFLVLIAMLACYIPARRAAKVDPMVALRYE